MHKPRDYLERAINHTIAQLYTSNDTPSRFKISAYKRALAVIRSLPAMVNQQAILESSLTPHMKNVCLAYIDGTLTISPPTLMEKLSEIAGIGPTRAAILLDLGLTKLSDLNKKPYRDKLTAETLAHLRMPPNKHLSHKYIADNVEGIIKRAGGIIVGSFRRGKDFSRDIDVQVVGDERQFTTFKEKLTAAVDKIIIYADGTTKCSALVALGQVVIKVDAFLSSKDEAVPMLLYSTGSKEFNQRMRARAKSMGFLLNQHGLFKGTKKITGLANERAYFTMLEMPYQAPESR